MYQSKNYEDEVETAAEFATLDILDRVKKHLQLHADSEQKSAELKRVEGLEKTFKQELKSFPEYEYMDSVWPNIRDDYTGDLNVELRELWECTLGVFFPLAYADCVLSEIILTGEGYIFRCKNFANSYNDCPANQSDMLKGLSGYGTTEESAKEHLVLSLREVIDGHAEEHEDSKNSNSSELRKLALEAKMNTRQQTTSGGSVTTKRPKQ